MKKLGIILLFLAVGVFAEIAGPDGSVSFTDAASPTQKKTENKFWTNTLNTYNMFRQVAASFVADVNAIVNVADAVQKQIDAVERMFLTIEDIAKQTEELYNKVTDTSFWNNMDLRSIDGAVNVVESLEEQVFQKADGLMITTAVTLTSDIRGAYDARHGIKNSVKDFGTLLKKQGRAFDSTASTISWISGLSDATYKYDLKALGEKKKTIEEKMINGGNTDPLKMAQGNRDIRREELSMTLLENEALAANVNFWAEILKAKTEALASTNSQRYGLFLELGGKFDE